MKPDDQIAVDLGRKLATQISRDFQEHIALVDDPMTKFKIATYAMAQVVSMTAAVFGVAHGMREADPEDVCRAVMDRVFSVEGSDTGGAGRPTAPKADVGGEA